LQGVVPVTQFGQMCQRLGIRILAANPPQAKGRVERNHGTHQDRLVKKMRVKKIKTRKGDTSNVVRMGTFLMSVDKILEFQILEFHLTICPKSFKLSPFSRTAEITTNWFPLRLTEPASVSTSTYKLGSALGGQ
jgi:hypothetical protein